MSQQEPDQVPAGFTPLPAGVGFSDAIQPSYVRVHDGAVSIGILPQAHHGNSMGIVHGGVLMTLADVAAASGLNVARGERAGTPTINLSVDFIAAARLGQWLQADTDQVALKRRFGFASGVIHSRDQLVARFHGTFYIPDHQGMQKGQLAGAGFLDSVFRDQ